jgi:hypothetical protein
MLTMTHDLREDVEELLGRLARINAQRGTLTAVAGSLHGAQASPTLATVLDQVEHDLTLAARDAGRVRDHAIDGGPR